MNDVDVKIFDSMVTMRRDLHRHPELSWHETRTANKIAMFLADLGLQPKTGVAGTGVVAEIPSQNDVPAIALRADTDALPIQEETGLPFSSTTDGIMHACGHDGHTSMLLGAATLLSRRNDLPAPVRLIFQPAEETGNGARAMIEAGVLDDVAMIFGGHLDRHFPTGTLAITEGAVNASSDRFCITITGRGGHAARPHEAIDAVVVGSLLVMSIQTIVSREVNPAHPSVVSVGRFDAGSASNVIADRATLEGSIRSQDQQVRRHLHGSIQRIADSVGQLHGASIEVEINAGTPPLINSPRMTALAKEAAAAAIGKENIRELTVANMGGEDFSYYLEQIPGCYIRIGSAVAGKEGYPAHSSKYDFDEQALAVGAAYYQAVALEAGRQVSDGR